MELSLGLIVVLILIIGAEFVNGWTDAPNAIATVVSTRVLSPRKAVLMAAVLNTLGVLSGTAVAATIGKGIVKMEAINLVTVGAAVTGIIIWSTVAWRFGLPTSESHALVAGLAGASLATAGPQVLLLDGWRKVLIGLGFSTFFGFFAGLLIVLLIYKIFRNVKLKTTKSFFSKAQIFSAAFMAFSHGSNDGQKFMGVFALALVLGGVTKEFHISLPVILVSSAIMGIGTSIGGYRIIKTMGMGIVKLETYQGFAAETGAALCIELASRLGIPLSTTHTITTSIMGVGAAKRLSAVRWGVVKEVVAAWVLTFPICAVIGYVVAYLFNMIF
ncbi:MAG: inorganic phosphate transporter [Clostridiales bacterium]|nr:inorganic phosphate transporter [Clostridiales bacterium]